jgi:hypothetical protein
LSMRNNRMQRNFNNKETNFSSLRNKKCDILKIKKE